MRIWITLNEWIDLVHERPKLQKDFYNMKRRIVRQFKKLEEMYGHKVYKRPVNGKDIRVNRLLLSFVPFHNIQKGK